METVQYGGIAASTLALLGAFLSPRKFLGWVWLPAMLGMACAALAIQFGGWEIIFGSAGVFGYLCVVPIPISLLALIVALWRRYARRPADAG